MHGEDTEIAKAGNSDTDVSKGQQPALFNKQQREEKQELFYNGLGGGTETQVSVRGT